MRFVKNTGILCLSVALVSCGTVDLPKVVAQAGNLPPSNETYPTQTEPITQPPAITPSAVAPDMLSYRLQTAKKIALANTALTFTGVLPDPLSAIPVIEISLNADGSIRDLDVRRMPRFYPETAQTAMTAIRRAAPFGSVAHLPQPWVFNETFLFNDDFKFQLHSLQP